MLAKPFNLNAVGRALLEGQGRRGGVYRKMAARGEYVCVVTALVCLCSCSWRVGVC